MSLHWCLLPKPRDSEGLSNLEQRLSAITSQLIDVALPESRRATLEEERVLLRAQVRAAQILPERELNLPRVGDSPRTIQFAWTLWDRARHHGALPALTGQTPFPLALAPFLEGIAALSVTPRLADLAEDRVLGIAAPDEHRALSERQSRGSPAWRDPEDADLAAMQARSLESRTQRQPGAPRFGDSPDSMAAAAELWRSEGERGHATVIRRIFHVSHAPNTGFSRWCLAAWDQYLPELDQQRRHPATQVTQDPVGRRGGPFTFTVTPLLSFPSLPESIYASCYAIRDPESMVRLASALDRLYAERRHSVALPANAAEIIQGAATWLRFWAERGFSVQAWF